jgi:hypothetical protein
MPSKLKAPMQPGEMGKIVQKIYDDINSVIDSLNLDLGGAKEPDEKPKAGSISVVKEGNTYSLRGKTEDGWASTKINLINSPKVSKLGVDNTFSNSDDIESLSDSTGGTVSDTISNTTGVDIAASTGTQVPTLAEFENAIASVISKINELINISNIQNDRINTLVGKLNETIRRIDE